MKQHPSRSRSRELVFCALSIALMVVCAWVTVPFGPVPFTLSTFALLFVLFTLPPRTAFAAIAGYVLLGALGLPVFSSFKGGLAALLGPTGGFRSLRRFFCGLCCCCCFRVDGWGDSLSSAVLFA